MSEPTPDRAAPGPSQGQGPQSQSQSQLQSFFQFPSQGFFYISLADVPCDVDKTVTQIPTCYTQSFTSLTVRPLVTTAMVAEHSGNSTFLRLGNGTLLKPESQNEKLCIYTTRWLWHATSPTPYCLLFTRDMISDSTSHAKALTPQRLDPDVHEGSPTKKGRADAPMHDVHNGPVIKSPTLPVHAVMPAAAAPVTALKPTGTLEVAPDKEESPEPSESKSSASPTDRQYRIVLQCKTANPALAHEQLAGALKIAPSTLQLAVNPERLQVSNAEKDLVIYLKPGNEPAGLVIKRLSAALKKGFTLPQFRSIALRESLLTSMVTHAEALFLTLSHNVPPGTVAEAIAESLTLDGPSITVRRGSEAKSLLSKMYYIVTVPPESFNDACGTLIYVNSGVGQIYGMLAPSVKFQYANGYRRFRCILAQPHSGTDTYTFIQLFESEVGAVAFWDRGRKENGAMTDAVSVSVKADSMTAAAIDELMDKLDGDEGTLSDGTQFSITEIDKEEYERQELRRTHSHPKAPRRK